MSDLTPRERLELLRREETAAQEDRNRRANQALRLHRSIELADAAGLAAPGDLLPTVAEIEAKRAELEVAGKPAGVRSLAKALHSSSTTIRRRLGKTK